MGPSGSSAATIPVLAAIYLSWTGLKAIGLSGDLVWIVTAVLASCSWLLSGAIKRWINVKHHSAMACTVALLGAIFLAIEASIVHVGIEHLMEKGSFQPGAAAIWFFSISLSLINVSCKWSWLGDPGEKAKARTDRPAATSGPTLVVDNRTKDEREKDNRVLAEICKQFAS